MSRTEITPDELNEIALAIEQVMGQLRAIEAAGDLQPMRYTARLCWEALYEPREILRAKRRARVDGNPYSSRG